MRGDGDANPYEQFAYDTNYIDAVIMRWHDEDTDGNTNENNDGEQYYLYDASFNVIALLEADGDVLERYRYTPYGQRIVLDADFTQDADNASDFAQQRGFQGLRHDEESGLIYNRARMLDPLTGRFTQRDPLGYPDGMNSYAAYHVLYGGVDPWGLDQVQDRFDERVRNGQASYHEHMANQERQSTEGYKVRQKAIAEAKARQKAAEAYAERIREAFLTCYGDDWAGIYLTAFYDPNGLNGFGVTGINSAWLGEDLLGREMGTGERVITGGLGLVEVGLTATPAKGFGRNLISEATDAASGITTKKVASESADIAKQGADFYVTPVGEAIPGTGYRALGGSAVDEAQAGLISPRPGGSYFTFDDITCMSPEQVQSLLQLPRIPSHVAVFDTSQILDDVAVPKGFWGEGLFPEPIVDTFPQWGKGGGTQAVTDTPIQPSSVQPLPEPN